MAERYSGRSFCYVQDSRENRNGKGMNVDKIRKALAPHNRSELFNKKPSSRTGVAPVSLPPLGPRYSSCFSCAASQQYVLQKACLGLGF